MRNLTNALCSLVSQGSRIEVSRGVTIASEFGIPRAKRVQQIVSALQRQTGQRGEGFSSRGYSFTDGGINWFIQRYPELMAEIFVRVGRG